MIATRVGKSVYPEEVERRYHSLVEVAGVVEDLMVLRLPESRRGKLATAVVMLRPGATPVVEERIRAANFGQCEPKR